MDEMAAIDSRRVRRIVATALVAFLLAACGSISTSEYDEPTDKALTALQETTDDFVTGLMVSARSEQNGFMKHQAFYKDADRRLRRLEFRVSSLSANERTEQLVRDIRASILGEGRCSPGETSLRDFHCAPENLAQGPSRAALEIARQNINQTIRAALQLELAKKRGLARTP